MMLKATPLFPSVHCSAVPRFLAAGILGGVLLAAALAPAAAMPKSGPKGQQCISTGTERRTGNEVDSSGNPTGRKFDCLYDYCEFCQDGSDNVACGSRGKTYDNSRDCKQVAASRPGGGVIAPQTIDPGVLAPETSSPPRRPPTFRPGGAIQQFQQR